MSSVPKSLISKYDGIGWIPTIRGCLSLDLIDNAESILGDADKYSIKFKTITGHHSQHYLIASSLLTVNDSKVGNRYDRTFRYIFIGSIHDEEIGQNFLAAKGLANDESLKTYINDEGLLIGQLIIVASEKEKEEGEKETSWWKKRHHLTQNEVNLLNVLKDLTKLNEEFKILFHVEAASMETLQKARKKMLLKWKRLAYIIENIKDNKTSRRPTFVFDVALTRDGILLLKDITDTSYRQYFAAPGTDDDYENNISLHRLFKSAMNYVKYLFHSNYHHNEEHDTYLPASNLHPALNETQQNAGQLNLYAVFRHQMDAFMVPIIKQKRNDFRSYTVDPIGVLLYTKAFIGVFGSNQLVDQCVVTKSQEYCDILQKEIDLMTSENSVIVRALITSSNPFVIISGVLAFVFTCLKTLDLLKLTVRDLISGLPEIPSPYNAIGKFAILAIIALGIYIIPRSLALKKQFKLKKKSGTILFKNSNLKDGRFSFWYDLYIKRESIKLLFINKSRSLLNNVKKQKKVEFQYDFYSILRSIVIFILLLIAGCIFVCLLFGKY